VGVDISTVLLQDITLVYDSLDLQTIDTGELKTLLDIKPVVMDTPELIVTIFPPIQLVIQFGDRRIRITHQQKVKEIGGVPLWEIAHKCCQLIPKSQLIAYGFNYDVGVVITEQDPQEVTRNLFISDPSLIDDLLEANLVAFTPRLKFEKNEIVYDLLLELLDEKRIKVHLNTHFSANELPTQDMLKQSFYEEFEYFLSLLSKIFGQGDE